MPFPDNLTEIDELTRPHHVYLTTDDECLFLGEYTARRGYAHSVTNQLLINLKKPMDRRRLPEWPYKGNAIRRAARAFRNAINEEELRKATFVPVPPSKAKNDPMHDDRMVKMIRAMDQTNPVDCRELVVQAESMAAAHESDIRPGPDELCARYSVDQSLIEPQPTFIIVVDDLITTGAHFTAAKRVLRGVFPAVSVVGYFVARRVPETNDVEAFFEKLDQ